MGATARKIVTVVGARPQFVKAAVVSRALAARSGEGAVREVLVHTGQHFSASMSDVFFEQMAIPRPAHHLQINSLSHGAMTGRMLEAVEAVLLEEKPDRVLVYGDTNSTLAGALAAAKLHVPVAHVEAGLRSFNRRMPEEINRVLTDHTADALYCPTRTAVANLAAEGLAHDPGGALPGGVRRSVLLTGDVMHDAALFYAQRSAEPGAAPTAARVLAELGGAPFALCTLHRAENTDDPARLAAIVRALAEISARGAARGVPVVLPLHPRTRALAPRAGVDLEGAGLRLLDPVPYFDMLELLKACAVVLTDSGGLQKEAFFFARPCVTLRDETEWVELVEHGVNRLAGADTDAILAAFEAMRAVRVDASLALYGDGDAGGAIAAHLLGA
ncbi:MAG: UDP-N-acetylglucosamine 2-epimerase (non-hydrolyzing) [Desulfovibrionaceae bacterium]|jgi:UDP-GlcNAc3NAcA epimerase|nr:UDP-N-acetylglucosamine 2-epimerase (non-hydrolyzing) [Desulfovibrionaceae bacterium]